MTSASDFGLIGLAIFAAVVALAVVMARRIYRTLGGEPEEAARLAQAVAAGDLTRMMEQRGAEGSLMESMRQITVNLRGIIEHIQDSAGKVGAASAGLSGQMEQINQAAKQASGSLDDDDDRRRSDLPSAGAALDEKRRKADDADDGAAHLDARGAGGAGQRIIAQRWRT